MVRRGNATKTIILPIAVLVGVAMAVVVAFIWFSARNQDQIALEQSKKSVEGALIRRAAQLANSSKDYAWWNDSVENLVLDLDLDWADLMIGFYNFETYGYERSFVIDGQNWTIYSSLENERVDDDAFSVLQHGLSKLIEQTRASSRV